MNAIDTEIEEAWNFAASELGVPGIEHPSMKTFLYELRDEECSKGEGKLEPWLPILDQGILWIGALHLSLDNDILTPNAPAAAKGSGIPPRLRAFWALAGSLSTQCVSFRWLCYQGLGFGGGIILRSIIETVRAAIIIADDEELTAKYVSAQEDSEIRKLWRSELSGSAARRRLEKALEELPSDMTNDLVEWLRDDFSFYSQFVHAGYQAAAIGSRPIPFDGVTSFAGTFGASSVLDYRMLERACKLLWLFQTFVSRSILGVPDSHARLRDFDMTQQLDQWVAGGYYVFRRLLAKHWDAALPTSPPEQI